MWSSRFSFGNTFKLLFLFFVGLLAATALQAWTGPTAAPSGNNVAAPINVGTTDQVKNAGLSVNALAVFGGSYFTGNVGIGALNPAQKLVVTGDTWLNGNLIVQSGNVGIGTAAPALSIDDTGDMARKIYEYDLGVNCNTQTPGFGAWENVFPAFSYQKKSATSKLMIIVSGSMRFNLSNTAGNTGQFGVLVNGTTYTMCGQSTEANPDSHESPFCRTIISGLGTGTWSIQPQVLQNYGGSANGSICLGNFSPIQATIEEIY